MKQSPSWEPNRSSASQEIPPILWSPKVHYRIHKSPPPVPNRRISLVLRSLCIIRNTFKFLRWGVVSISPKPQYGRPPLVGYPLLLIQYIRSYPIYLKAVPSSATWGRAITWWPRPTYHCDRDPFITVTGTHLSVTWTHLSVTGTHLSLWQGPTYHCDRDPLISATGTHLSRTVYITAVICFSWLLYWS